MGQTEESFAVKNPGEGFLWVVCVLPIIIGLRWIVMAFWLERRGFFLFGGTVFIGLGVLCAFANMKRYRNWIQVTNSVITLYIDRKPINTLDAADVARMVVRSVGSTKAQTITLFGEKSEELITLSANAENMDLLIDLVGRNKLFE